jgi:hypothetical protein
MWIKMRNFRYVMIITCIILDIINIYWFQKMFKGVLIVISTNWEHHKTHQLEQFSNYRKNFRNKITESKGLILEALHKINHGRYLGIKFIERNVHMPKVLNDFLNRNTEENN